MQHRVGQNGSILQHETWNYLGISTTNLVHLNALAVEVPLPHDVLCVRVAELGVGVRDREVELVEVEVAEVHGHQAEDDPEDLEADADVVGVLLQSTQVVAVAE